MTIGELRKNKKGFSVLEVTMALGIITTGLMGVFSLVLQNLQVQTINKDYLVASMLAQEGLELVRNVRDTNFLQNRTFSSGLLPDGANSTITVDNDGPPNVNIQNVADMAAAVLYLDNTNKVFHHDSSGSSATIYHRLITIVEHTDYLEVHSNVQWAERGRTHNYEAVTNLYNWW